jgi:PAS domain S-box-containing protein
MKIGYKLVVGYVTIALFTGIVGYFSSRQMVLINRQFDNVSTQTLPHIKIIEDMKKGVLRIVASTNEYAFLALLDTGKSSHESGENHEENLLEEGANLLEAAVTSYGKHNNNTSPADRENYAAIKAGTVALFHSSDEIIKGVKNKAAAAELHELKETFERDEQALLRLIDNALNLEYGNFKTDKDNVAAAIGAANKRIALLAVGTFLLAILSGIIFSAPISRRIEKLKEAVERLGRGEPGELVESGSTDELGILANSFNNMSRALNQSRDELLASRNYLNDIIHSMIDALIVVNRDGTIKSVNAATCIMLGYETELAGLPFTTIMPDSPLAELVEKGHLRDVERTCLTSDGREIHVAFSGSVIWSADNQTEGFVCIAHDITERKSAELKLQRYSEELQESNDELRSFAYIVSHDLRAPLVNIKGFAAELNSSTTELRTLFDKLSGHLEEQERQTVTTVFNEDLPEALDFINSSVARMDGLINAILKLSRLGHRELKQQPLQIRELVQSLLKSLNHQLESSRTRVIIGELPDVSSDRIAMEQVLGNLLDNAVKYLDPSRPGLLEIHGEAGDSGVTFHVRDNGRGIEQTDLGKIFEIFRRAGRPDVPGEGMGLAYVKTLVRRLGGQIWCQSVPGTGSTFSFTIPRPESARYMGQNNFGGIHDTPSSACTDSAG